MPILTGIITPDGAAVDLLIHPPRLAPVEPRMKSPIAVRAILDTGAGATGVSRSLLKSLLLPVQDSVEIRGPVGSAQLADRYWIKLSFVSGGSIIEFGEALVLTADCFDDHEDHQALIGRDLLDHCIFQYLGPDKKFTFAF